MADDWQTLSSRLAHIFVAEGLRQGQQQLDESEEGLYNRAFTYDEIAARIRRGELLDSPTIAAYGCGRLLI